MENESGLWRLIEIARHYRAAWEAHAIERSEVSALALDVARDLLLSSARQTPPPFLPEPLPTLSAEPLLPHQPIRIEIATHLYVNTPRFPYAGMAPRWWQDQIERSLRQYEGMLGLHAANVMDRLSRGQP